MSRNPARQPRRVPRGRHSRFSNQHLEVSDGPKAHVSRDKGQYLEQGNMQEGPG